MAGTCAADVHDFQMIQYDDMFPLLMLKPCCHSAADYIIATNRTATGHWIDSDGPAVRRWSVGGRCVGGRCVVNCGE